MTFHSLPDLTDYKSKAARRIAKLAAEHTEKQRELGEVGRAYEQARHDLEDARNRDTKARALAAWYQGLLENERRKGERTVSFTEMLRQAHGLGPSEGDDGPPAA